MPDHELFSIKKCTLAELIDAGQAYLAEYPLVYCQGTDNAFDESAWLAIEACERSPVDPIDNYQIPVTAAQLQRAKEWYRKRVEERIPVAYLTGRAWFAGIELAVDDRALIPRSPFAELVLDEFVPWLPQPPSAALDLCCGGGCIAMAIAHVFEHCMVDAVDLSSDALELAATNVANHQLGERVVLHQGDLFEPLINTQKRYDLIISNPPYVDAADMQVLAAELQHEPSMGLAAGADGLDIVAKIIASAKQYLQADGVLIVEVGNSQQAVEDRFGHLGPVWLEFEHGGDGVFLLQAGQL